MNYYEHHIRDYDTATAHLTWEQDMAYTRLLRWYYRKEKPIPSDVKEACRQIRATSRTQQAAVQAVLDEFFQLRPDGWHKDECDDAIARYVAGEPAREQKKTNEQLRLDRHRNERSHLFRVINDAGIHRPWNVPIAELRALAAGLQTDEDGGTGTESATKPATPATATATPETGLQRLPNTQYPLPTPHSPIPTSHDVALNTGASPLLSKPGEPASTHLNGHAPDSRQPGLLGDEPIEMPPGPPPCPHQQLLALYRKHLGHLRQPVKWEGAREDALRARWRECAKPSEFSKGYATVEAGLKFWDRFFAFVASTDLAKGFPPRQPGGKVWYPDLPWLVKQENFLKVIEGKYAE